MALQAPTHGMRLGLIDDFHLVHITVTALARNPAIHVSGVVEVDVVRRLMHANPFDWLTVVTRKRRIHRAMKRRKFWAISLDVLVTVPARISRRHVRMTCDIDEGMAITTIQTKLVDVDLMRKGNRLRWLVTYDKSLGCRVVTEGQSHACAYGSKAKYDF